MQTQMMSNKGDQRKTLLSATRHLWALGGVRAYYRGLGVSSHAFVPFLRSFIFQDRPRWRVSVITAFFDSSPELNIPQLFCD